jgi:hypothetical protein
MRPAEAAAVPGSVIAAPVPVVVEHIAPVQVLLARAPSGRESRLRSCCR